MIKISVDEAGTYDMLAILAVKQRAHDTLEGDAAYDRLYSEIEREVGKETHDRVMLSREFARLIDVNQLIFNTVDRIKELTREGGGALMSASIVDDLNYERYQVKAALQRSFFPDVPLVERKIGYREDKV